MEDTSQIMAKIQEQLQRMQTARAPAPAPAPAPAIDPAILDSLPPEVRTALAAHTQQTAPINPPEVEQVLSPEPAPEPEPVPEPAPEPVPEPVSLEVPPGVDPAAFAILPAEVQDLVRQNSARPNTKFPTVSPTIPDAAASEKPKRSRSKKPAVGAAEIAILERIAVALERIAAAK